MEEIDDQRSVSIMKDIFSDDKRSAMVALSKMNHEAENRYAIVDMYALGYALDRHWHPGWRYMVALTALFRVMVDSMINDNDDASLEYLREWLAYLQKKIGGGQHE